MYIFVILYNRIKILKLKYFTKKQQQKVLMCHHLIKYFLSLGRSLPDGMFQFAEFSFLVILNVLVLSQDPVDDDGQDTDPLLLQPSELVEHRVTQLDELSSSGSLG